MSEEYVRICPKCNSTDVSPDFSSPAAVAAGALYMYRCNRCGFVGDEIFFPKVPKDRVPKPKNLKEIKKDYDSVNITYGRGIIGLWKISGPFLLFVSLVFLFISPWPENLFFVLYGIPVSIILTFYAYSKKYFEKHKILRKIALIIILYFAFGGYILYLFLFHTKNISL